jgi:hypothetical protein
MILRVLRYIGTEYLYRTSSTTCGVGVRGAAWERGHIYLRTGLMTAISWIYTGIVSKYMGTGS